MGGFVYALDTRGECSFPTEGLLDLTGVGRLLDRAGWSATQARDIEGRAVSFVWSNCDYEVEPDQDFLASFEWSEMAGSDGRAFAGIPQEFNPTEEQLTRHLGVDPLTMLAIVAMGVPA